MNLNRANEFSCLIALDIGRHPLQPGKRGAISTPLYFEKVVEKRKRCITVARPGAVDTPFWEKVPLRRPKDAAPPYKVARPILDANQAGHSGQLDLA